MKNDKKINYGNALFSVAMIDLKAYTEAVLYVDKRLEEANFVLNMILSKSTKDELYCEIIKKHSFAEFAKVQKSLKELEKQLQKYMSRLELYLTENPDKKKEFDEQLNVLIPIMQDKQKFVDIQIKSALTT